MTPAQTAELIDKTIGERQIAAIKRRNEHLLRLAEDAKKTLQTVIDDAAGGFNPRYVGHLYTKVREMQGLIHEMDGIRNM